MKSGTNWAEANIHHVCINLVFLLDREIQIIQTKITWIEYLNLPFCHCISFTRIPLLKQKHLISSLFSHAHNNENLHDILQMAESAKNFSIFYMKLCIKRRTRQMKVKMEKIHQTQGKQYLWLTGTEAVYYCFSLTEFLPFFYCCWDI